MNLQFDNRFTALLPQDAEVVNARRQVVGAFWSAVAPEAVAAPRVVAVSGDMLAALGLSAADARSDVFLQVMAGNRLLPGMRPFASNYGGHQFGQWAGQLGDGRAITLGEVLGADGGRWALQLKGAGATPYSRRGDGRAVLRSSVREFLCSEAMHHLGVPSTRALALVATGEPVVRDMFYDGRPQAEPGAVVCRVAPTFLRFGHFELPAARGDVGLLRQLVDFCIAQDFAHLADVPDAGARYAAWFAEVAVRTARLVAGWMRVGFVHGVLNTDNMGITGLTLDYGPYGWVEAFDPDFTPNTSDTLGRYRFGFQPRVVMWNLQQLAGALAPLFDEVAGGVAPLHAGLQAYADAYAQADRQNACRKLGLPPDGDATRALALMRGAQAWMQAAAADMTLFFRTLAEHPADALAPADFAHCWDAEGAEQATHQAALQTWLHDWRAALRDCAQPEAVRQQLCAAANPRFVLRNWLVQQAIEQAEQGDDSGIHTLLRLLQRPYDTQPGDAPYITRAPAWARDKPGCGRLSCSS